MILFTIGSLLAGFRSNLQLLLFARVIQGIGAAMTMATNLGIITEAFPMAERGRALGITGFIAALGAIMGPGIGGLLLGFLPWGYIFWINVLVGIALMILGAVVLNKDKTTALSAFDRLGATLLVPGLILLFGAFFIGQQVGFSNGLIVGAFVLAIVLLGSFIWHELHSDDPILDFGLFKNRQFSVSLTSALFIFMTNFFFNVITPFYLENARQIKPQTAGLLLMIFPVAQLIASPISGAIADKLGANRLSLVGLLLLTIGQLSLILVGQSTSMAVFGVGIAILGFGNGTFQAPNNALSMGSVPSQQLGAAGGINAFARELGMVTGIAASTTILFSAMGHKVGHHVSGYLAGQPAVFIYGMHVAFAVALTVCVILLIVNFYDAEKDPHGRVTIG
ncbi:MFS transporter [Furfurilactobacillus sp. OKN36]